MRVLIIFYIKVLGFAVDYSTHLCHMYEIALHKEARGKRVDEALTRMGHTVLAGAVTTFASGAVMFLCK
jgi:ribosomal protein S18 acetylase RimI-like enzyme